MKKRLYSLAAALLALSAVTAKTEVTSTQAKNLYQNTSKKRVSVHDPSIVYEPTTHRYYIFGSHRDQAYTTDLQNWTKFSSPWQVGTNFNASNADAFVTPAVKTVRKGGEEVSFPAFNATDWAGRGDASYNINGNMWAPDVIWNPTMQKWCQYLSINGNDWHSSIILLTSDHIEGPYLYQGPVVISGFDSGSHSYHDTDLELVLGPQSSLPSRYTGTWSTTSKPSWPNNIDPCVFYDEEGRLWMTYGSWSGGIWMLRLNEENGLRDYDTTYSGTNTDPYFGKRIAGGYYVSGEASYITYIGGYYYLFMTYGGLDAAGGYVMRVFRSQNPDGPYVDAQSRSAIFSSYVMNYGKNSDNRGVKIMGAYDHWGFQSQGTVSEGELSQGHNSIIAAPDGRTYLVYHTRFNNGNEGHQVRVHQMFQTKNGWLVAAPFEYNGDQLTDEIIRTQQLFTAQDIAGTYHLLVHKFDIDYKNKEVVEPAELTLTADGKVSGRYTGTWSMDEGTSYISMKLGSTTYNGVIIEQTMDQKNIKTISFSMMTGGGLNIWGYKYRPDYEIAWQVNNQKVSVTNNQVVRKNIDLYGQMPMGSPNLQLAWSSSHPDIISDYGKYYPIGLQDNTDVTLTARISSGSYFWQQDYTAKAMSETNAQASSNSWENGIVAHYTFDDESLSNSVNPSQQAQLLRKSITALPTVDASEPLRNGNTLHLNFGNNGRESYAAIPNPLKNLDLSQGATISFFVKRNDDNLWDALFGMTDGTARLFMTGNLYVGYNDGQTASDNTYNNWIDINHPETVQTGKLPVGAWNQVSVTFSPTVNSSSGGITIYVNGSRTSDKYNESLNGVTAKTRNGFNYQLILQHMAACDQLLLGCGSFWGSADARFDDVIIHQRALTLSEVMGMNQMTDRADKASQTSGITETLLRQPSITTTYDLCGRRVDALRPGLYIKNNKKILIR